MANVHTLKVSEWDSNLNALLNRLETLHFFIESNQFGLQKIHDKLKKRWNALIKEIDVEWNARVSILWKQLTSLKISKVDFMNEIGLFKSMKCIYFIKSILQSKLSKLSESKEFFNEIKEKQEIKTILGKDNILELQSHYPFLLKTWNYISLFQSACQFNAFKCIEWLLIAPHSTLHSSLSYSLDSQYMLHWIVLYIKDNQDIIKVLECILDKCPKSLLEFLINAKDSRGRTALHYSASYGIHSATQLLLQHIPQSGIKSKDYWKDEYGHSPLELSLLFQHSHCVQLFINHSNHSIGWIQPNDLFISCKLGDLNSMKCILSAIGNTIKSLNLLNQQEQNPLHVLAEYGHVSLIQYMMDSFPEVINHWINELDLNGRSPVVLASLYGHLESVKILAPLCKVLDRRDRKGLNAHEHAVYRGYTSVAGVLKSLVSPYPFLPFVSSTVYDSVPIYDSHTHASNPSPYNSFTNHDEKNEKEHLYGQDILQKESLIYLYLGSLDTRTRDPPLILDFISKQQLYSGYSLVITCKNASLVGSSVFQCALPLTFYSLKPIVFKAKDVSLVEIYLDVYPNHVSIPTSLEQLNKENGKSLARAILLLSSPRESLWLEKNPLGGRYCIPFMCCHTMNKIGKIIIETVIVKPFHHPSSDIHSSEYAKRSWKALEKRVIGHRGLGMNRSRKDHPNLQLGENTLQSLIQAGSFGAEYVEFDVQLTRDHVPVLYHDFRMNELDVDVPVHALNLQEFLNIHPPSNPSKVFKSHKIGKSKSLEDFLDTLLIKEFDSTKASIKGNGFGTIQGPFATLEEALKHVPVSLGFNIEVKYPNTGIYTLQNMFREIEEAEEDQLNNAEINVFIDAILRVVFDYGKTRNVYFSSFHPDVCLLLCHKQNRYPVFFLTEGGTAQRYDVRLNSLKSSLQVALEFGCLGIVTASNPIIEAPKLIQKIRSNGILLFSYGSLNNILPNAQLQKEYGVDGIIVDKVRWIHSGLK